MKKTLLSLSLIAILATPSFAYVQGGDVLGSPSANRGTANDGVRKSRKWMDSNPHSNPGTNPTPEPIFDPLGEPVTRPIPEPGTMVLASLGLLALGVSRARRRGH